MRTCLASPFELDKDLVWEHLQEAVAAKGGTENAIFRMTGNEGKPLVEAIANMLVVEQLKAANRFPISIDYGQSPQDMIFAGNYDKVSGSIMTYPFALEGRGTVEREVLLVNFNRYVSSQEVIQVLDAMGLAPARIEHLLALGAQYPNLQHEFQIIALGSVMVDGHARNVPYLGGYRDDRYLAFDWFGGRWHPQVRFAAIRKGCAGQTG